MKIGTITCSYYMRIYGYKKPENFVWGDMTARYRAEFTREDFLQLAGEIRALGYDGIEIWEPTFSHLVYSEEDAKAMGQQLRDMGFRAVVYCIGGWTPQDVSTVEPAYRFARALGSHVATGCMAGEGIGDLLAEMERCGKAYGVKYAIENHPAPNLESPEEIAKTIAPFETIGANLDTGIYNSQGYDLLTAAQVLKGRVYHVHLKDTFTGGEDCFPLGQGNAPLGALIRQLKEDGYPEMLSVEFEYNGDPTTGLKESMDFIQNALA